MRQLFHDVVWMINAALDKGSSAVGGPVATRTVWNTCWMGQAPNEHWAEVLARMNVKMEPQWSPQQEI